MVIEGFSQLKQHLHQRAACRAVVAAAHDAHTLEGVWQAQDDGLIAPLLVGRRQEIMDLYAQRGRPVPPEDIVDAQEEDDCARQAVALIRAGRGDMLIKGLLQTGTLLRAVVDRQTGIRAGELMSHVAVLQVPRYHKLLFLSDGGMIVSPDLGQKRGILKNVLELCRFLGYERPKAAVLCAVEQPDPRMPETLDAATLKAEALAGNFGPCAVEGPISLDLATDAAAAAVKGFDSPVAGDADILLVPSIVAGNLLGKALYGLAGGEMAGLVLGAAVPITVNSRGASAKEKYDSILLCAAMARRGN